MMRLITKTLLIFTFVICSVVLQRTLITPVFSLDKDLTKLSSHALDQSFERSDIDFLAYNEGIKQSPIKTSYRVEYKEEVNTKIYTDEEVRLLQRKAWKEMKHKSGSTTKEKEKISSSKPQKNLNQKRHVDFKIEELDGIVKDGAEGPSQKRMAMRNIDLGKVDSFKVKKPKVFKVTSLLNKVNIQRKLAKLKREEQKRQKQNAHKVASAQVAKSVERKKSVEDKVATRQSASIGAYDPTNVENFNQAPKSPLAEAMKEVNKLKKKKTQKKNEDLMVFDYSSDEHVKGERDELNDLFVGSQNQQKPNRQELGKSKHANHMGQLTNVKISQNVQNVIKRELNGKTGSASSVSVSSQAPMEDMTTHAPKLANHNNKASQGQQFSTKGQVDYAKLFRAGVEKLEEGVDSQTRMIAYQPGLGMAKEKEVYNYEFVPEYNLNKYYIDENEGVIEIKKDLNNSKSVMRGTFLKNGHVRTKAEIVLEKGVGTFKVPFFKQETLYNFLDAKDLRGYGAFLLLEVGETITSVDLDGQYEAKVLLNDDLEPIKEGKDHRYVMFVGASAGNTLISYQTHEGQIADHVVHLVPDEVLYVPAILLPEGEEKITLEERNIMSREGTPLKMDSDRLSYFNQNTKVQRDALNHYSLVRPVRPLGMRKYFEIDSPIGYVMVGTEDEDTLEIPSQKFVDQVFDQMRVDDLQGRCLVQFNFDKRVEEFKVNGETRKGPMYLEKYFLDRDGIFNRQATTLATKAFVLGDLQGVMNIQIKYEDGSEDIAQTFCSEETYLVEHF